MTAPPWKGLDADRPPVFIGYDQTERMLAALLDQAARWRPDAVVGIARGGVVPATMAASLLGLELGLVGFDRATGTTTPIGPDPGGPRILLVDDGASSGRTLQAVRAWLRGRGRDCLTLAVVHDPDSAAHVPDLSHPMRDLWRFPWERGEATPAGRARRATGAGPDRRTEAPYVGLDLDGLLAAGTDWPDIDPGNAVALTRLPPAPALAALAARGLPGIAVEPAEPDLAMALTRLGCTHAIVADPGQAILVAASAAHLLVTWWSVADRRGYLVSAAGKPSSITTPPAAAASSGSCVTSSTGKPRAPA